MCRNFRGKGAAPVDSIPVNTDNDGGLTGITLDPDFKTMESNKETAADLT